MPKHPSAFPPPPSQRAPRALPIALLAALLAALLCALPLSANASGGSGGLPSAAAPTPVPAGSASEPEGSGEAGLENSGPLTQDVGQTVVAPIDPRYLYDIPFGRRSFWIQPWRAYLDTWPASHLLEAVGMDFPSKPAVALDTAHLLHDSGYTLARTGIDWNAMSFEDPTVVDPTHVAAITARLTAMHQYGIRPLIVLNANSGGPVPLRGIKLQTVTEAPAGAQTVTLTPASAAAVVPHRTGFNHLAFGGAADILITSVNAQNVATLARPLLAPLPAGSHSGSTLRFGPFQSPTLANGAPNPGFQETMGGWLAYVNAVNRLASSVVGPGGYDLEIWNEVSFGSQFLSATSYYAGYTGGDIEGAPSVARAEPRAEAAPGDALEDVSEPAETGASETSDPSSEAAATALAAPARGVKPPGKVIFSAVVKALIAETVALVRDPAHGFSPAVSITNGFASEGPFRSGVKGPIGMTALSKHPYTTQKFFPADWREGKGRTVNALGRFDTANKTSTVPLFIANYQSLFPEYYLTDTSTETLIRDIAPFTTYIYKLAHGREVGPPGGAPLQKWVTEFDMRPLGVVVGPDEKTPESGPAATISPADSAHFQAKVMMRSVISNVSKGMSREYGGDLGLQEGFLQSVEANPSVYPGDAKGGETMSGMREMLSQFHGPGPGGPPRQLVLSTITQSGNHAQFEGDGKPAHPSLYDRDVLAVFPYQSSPTRFEIPVYVMTRDLLTLYNPGASPADITRFDLPNENFQITLGNLPESSAAPQVSAFDPLLKASTPAHLVSRSGRSATFEIAATDYPRILSINYGGAIH